MHVVASELMHSGLDLPSMFVIPEKKQQCTASDECSADIKSTGLAQTDATLFLNHRAVCEMMQVARECRGNHSTGTGGGGTAPHEHSLLTFGEFCLFSADLQHGYQAPSPAPDAAKQSPPPLLGRQCSERGPANSMIISSKNTAPCEVFLGGSCNPTSWRQDVAIPTLRAHGISFYNPQVTHWEEALLEREHVAKSSAAVLFFVFDRSTRNVASMVEVAYMAALPRKIILVLDAYPGPGHLIENEPMSHREYEELSGGLNTVQDIVERRGIPVFSQLPHALSCTAKILREDLWPQQLGAEDNVTPVRYPELQLSRHLSKVHAAYQGRSSISLSEANLVFRSITGRLLTRDELITIIAAKKGISGSSVSVDNCELSLKEVSLTLEELSCVVAEFSYPRPEQRRLKDVFTNSVMTPLQRALGWAVPRRSPRHLPRNVTSQPESRLHATTNGSLAPRIDVYLGGASAVHDPWRCDVAEPLLKKHGLTFCSPSSSVSSPHQTSSAARAKCDDGVSRSNCASEVSDECTKSKSTSPDRRKMNRNCKISSKRAPRQTKDNTSAACQTAELPDSNGRLLPSEAANIDQCRILLFVISNKTRSVSAMAMAAHYVGMGCNVVLCVQDLEIGSLVDGEMLTKYATKDYNRGRSYLTDQARKDGIPVFDKLTDALECVVKKSNKR
ncbi:hypothetical protein FHG87_000015 [Trinorchestia longiramus]|nr:hypothetical protein FHG87_000015 [Trinorchestia longiramus]